MAEQGSAVGRQQARVGRAIAGLYRWLERNRVTRLPWAVVQTYSRAQGALLSGSMAYYTFLSLLPLLLVAAFALGTIARSNPGIRDAVIRAVNQVVPGVSGKDALDQVIDARVAFGVLGLASVVYASSGFIGALTACLNRMWGTSTGRNPLGQKLLNFLVVVLLGSVLLGSVGLTVWFGYLTRSAFGSRAGPVVHVAELLSGPVAMLLVLLLAYRMLPARRLSWASQLPGAAVGALGIELLKRGFTFWAEHSAGVSRLPRSLVSAVLLLVWLGFFAQVVLYGAAVNVVLDRRRRGESLFPDPADGADAAAQAGPSTTGAPPPAGTSATS